MDVVTCDWLDCARCLASACNPLQTSLRLDSSQAYQGRVYSACNMHAASVINEQYSRLGKRDLSKLGITEGLPNVPCCGQFPSPFVYFEVLAKVGCFGHQQGRWRGDVETAAGDGRGAMNEALEDLWLSQRDRTVRSPCLCRNKQVQARGYLESHPVIVHTDELILGSRMKW
jgi:hypothetical protein